MCFLVPPDGGSIETSHMETTTQQTLHYSLANQQVQIHRIGEDGQVQVVSGPSSSASSSLLVPLSHNQEDFVLLLRYVWRVQMVKKST